MGKWLVPILSWTFSELTWQSRQMGRTNKQSTYLMWLERNSRHVMETYNQNKSNKVETRSQCLTSSFDIPSRIELFIDEKIILWDKIIKPDFDRKTLHNNVNQNGIRVLLISLEKVLQRIENYLGTKFVLCVRLTDSESRRA